MSTTTNFKRVALVAVAALGLGVLSSVPAQAAIGASSIVLNTTAGTAGLLPGTADNTDTATGALVSVQFLSSGSSSADSVTITIAAKSKPNTTVAYPKALIYLVDTAAASTAVTAVRMDTRVAAASAQTSDPQVTEKLGAVKTTTVGFGVNDSGTAAMVATPTANTYAYAQFRLFLDTATTRASGSYVYTVIATPFEASGTATNASVKTIDVTVVVGAAGSTVSAAAYSYAAMTQGSTWAGAAASTTSVDSAVSVALTASTTPRAVVRIGLRTSTNTTTAQESVTVNMSIGSSGTTSGVAVGKNVTYAYTDAVKNTGYLEVFLYSDGTAGAATVAITAGAVVFPTKSVTFTSTTSTKIVATKVANTLGLGSNSNVVLGKATDAALNVVASDADGASGVFAYSSNLLVVSDSGTACTYDTTYLIHKCSLTGIAAGTANITLKNIGTGATATVNSAEVITVTVNPNPAASFKMEFGKTSYAPGEKAYLYLYIFDAAGKPAASVAEISQLVNASGITTANAFGNTGAAATLPASAQNYTFTAKSALLGSSTPTAEPSAVITTYMPASGGAVSVSATGGASLPAAAQATKITATTTVTDNAAAALAAVTALATTVASLKTLITTLTNLVLKIQKKVKA